MIVHIAYYKKGKLLGEGLIKERSSSNDRRALALQIGIKAYDRFVLDNGLVDSDTVGPEAKDIFKRLEFK
jgi:hypothetical protein